MAIMIITTSAVPFVLQQAGAIDEPAPQPESHTSYPADQPLARSKLGICEPSQGKGASLSTVRIKGAISYALR